MPLINKPGLLFTMITGGQSALEEGIFCPLLCNFFLRKHNKTEHSACYMLKLSTYAKAKRSISATVFSGNINLEREKCSFLTIYNVFSLSVFGNISNPKGAVL